MMDYLMIPERYCKDFYIIPPHILNEISSHPLLNNLFITDIGHFVEAAGHYKERKTAINEAILILCEKGKGEVIIEGNRFELQAHEAVFIRPGAAHSYRSDSDEPWTILWCHFAGSFVEMFINRVSRSRPVVHIEGPDLILIRQIFEDIFSFLKKGFSTDTMIYSSSAFHAVLGKLIFGNHHFHPEKKDEEGRRVETAIHFMLERLEGSVSPTLQQLADRTGLSASHFSAMFRSRTGFAPYDYFLRLKIQRACRYIESGEMNINQISHRFGYEDPYYFSRLFKKVMGISPAAYKKERAVIRGEVIVNNYSMESGEKTHSPCSPV